LPKKHFARIKFRDLNEYRPETDDFPEPVIVKRKRVRILSKTVTATAFTMKEPTVSAQLPESELPDDSDDEEDNVSIVSEFCSSNSEAGDEPDTCDKQDSENESDGNEADDESDNEKSSQFEEEEEEEEVECIVQELNINDIDGVDQQMKDNEANNKLVQEMAYFGIEHVLTGRNPGLIDHRGFQNVLKAMLVLNNTILSDFFVDKCFPHPGDRNMVSLKHSEVRN
jgi:hypothetical protein